MATKRSSTGPQYRILHDSGVGTEPAVSIITTVYDRVECLDACIRSVQSLRFDNYEHIIVADAPPAPITEQLRSLVARRPESKCRSILAVLESRANDWGITPAAAGLALARGKYVCFLSDDNGYKPEHFDKLVASLDHDPDLGFAYSGCLYNGSWILSTAPPSFGRIDLGQPLFRRDLFDRFFDSTLPFQQAAWDWIMIERLLHRRVRWKHIADLTFIFRLHKYPDLIPAPYSEA